MIHARITITAFGGTDYRTGADRLPRTFEVCGYKKEECKSKALDMYGDYSQVSKYVEFDPDFPPQYAHMDEEDL